MPKRVVAAVAAMVLLLVLPFAAKAAGDPLLYAVQEALMEEGYDPGWPDGVLGPQTRRAIRAFEVDYSLPGSGMMSPALVHALGLAAYATELGVMEFESVRMLAPPPGEERYAISADASAETGKIAGTPLRTQRSVAGYQREQPRQDQADRGVQVLNPVFRVRDFHPLLPDAVNEGAQKAPAAARPANETQRAAALAEGRALSAASVPSGSPVGVKPVAASAIPPVEDRFAPRNWLIRDFRADGLASGPAFGVFLEEGGKVAGPRFAERLRWEADGARFTMIYRNSIGQEVRRTGLLNGLNRIDGEAAGPGGKTWRWAAEAKPL